jgi:Inner membrane protein YgaP-like, transmembrane domain
MKNVGGVDQVIRFVAAGALILAGFSFKGGVRYGLWVVSLVPLLTAAFHFCPLWAAFKVNTYKK